MWATIELVGGENSVMRRTGTRKAKGAFIHVSGVDVSAQLGPPVERLE